MQQQFAYLSQEHKKNSNPTHRERIEVLDAMRRMLLENEAAIIQAITQDFSYRSDFETKIAELFPLIKSIAYTKKHLASWMSVQKQKVGFWFQPAAAKITQQPLGVVGIIVPWNYPIFMTLSPLIAAIAAGNRTMLKVSEFSPQYSELIVELCQKYLPKGWVEVVTGGPEQGAEFSSLPFGHLLFTGSSRVGKMVMRAASENLTPVTLELGGKSPVIIDDGFSIQKAANSIMFGKLLNAGQTCLAPDYVLLPRGQEKEFVVACKKAANAMYPQWREQDFTALSCSKQYERHVEMIADAEANGATVEWLFDDHEPRTSGRKHAASIVMNATDSMQILQDEIFGPSLPVLTYDSLDDAINYVNNRPNPLALYFYSHHKKNTQRLVTSTLSGGMTINDTLLHVSQDALPFGGVGASGMGQYHGIEGFRTFSKAKGIFHQSRFATTPLMYPPFKGFARTMYKIMRGKK